MPRSSSRFCVLLVLTGLLSSGAAIAQSSPVVVGANVNMVSGASFPDGDPFQRQQNEPSVAFSSRNNLHLLAGANDYRAVDVPGLPGGRETGDSWLSYFWSTNGGGSWRSTLIPGYPQDPACDGTASEPTLCGYAAGADPVVRAGVNGMFYYSGIVFERTDPSRSAIFVSRFIDLNNDEGGDPIRYIDTVLLDTNDDGLVFLDKSWIGVDIPAPGAATKALSVVQRNGSPVAQTISCGNLYVGYAAIGGEGQDLRSEIRLATSTDCGDTWAIQLISQPDSLNQGANIAIDPMSGDVHVVWRRFDTVETFLGIPAAGCPADPSSWEVSEVWPVSSITVAGVTYTMEEAQALLGTKHKGDESIKVVNEVIAAKLNLLTGGGDPVPGFNPNTWGQQLSAYIAEAEAWLVDNPVGSDPKNPEKQVGMDIKKDIQEILLGSGTCSGGGGTAGGSAGETNAILISSSTDGGQTFTAPVEIHESSTFDQGSTTFSFRTTAYPTVTVDATGRIYVAWAARGFATVRDDISEGDARIVLSMFDGATWHPPYAVDEPNPLADPTRKSGHQIKPSLLFAGGQLNLVYYDFRQDVSNIFETFVVDLPEADRLRHTVDVRIATALPEPMPAVTPVFTDYSLISPTSEPTKPSGQASRYKFLTAVTEYLFPPDNLPDSTVQAEYMVPNYPMFADGTTPFIGDYVDIAAPNLIFEEGIGWRFATDPGDVQLWQAVWSDNRDVIPPPDGDWSKYVAPITQAQVSLFDPTVTLPSCNDVIFPDAPPQWQAGSLYTGTRNQNVYSASITQGLIVAAPGNNRPLVDDSGSPLERGFVVYVQNSTSVERSFQLTVSAPTGVSASFVQGQAVTSIQVAIPPYSSAAETVYALSATGTPASETIQVDVTELGGTLAGSVLLNGDPEAPDPMFMGGTSLLSAEVHNPAILNPAILNPAILNPSADPSLCTSDPTLCVQNPAILNPAILNPAILNPAIFNPAILNPAILNPAIFNPAILNPAILNPAIFNPAIFNPAILNPAILNPAILNPAIMNPAILNPAILNPAILNPAILNPAILNPAILNPAILNTTTADSGQVDVTFAVRNDGNATTAYDLNLAAQQLAGLDYQLLVYSLNETPVTDGCTLTSEAQQQLIFLQDDPLGTPLDGTFYLEPGEEVLVTFRVTPDVDSPTPADPVADFDVADLSGQVISQPPNTDGSPSPPDDQFGPLPIVSVTFREAWGWDVVASGPNDTVANQFEICTAADVCQDGVTGSGPGQYVSSTGIDVDSSGNLYTVGWGSERVQVSDVSGNFVRIIGGPAEFNNPSGVAVNEALDRVYVADRLENEIEVYDRLGNFVTTWGTFGFGAGQFVSPYDLALDAAGNLYIADADDYSIQVLDSSGGFVLKLGWGVDTGAGAFEVCTPATLPCQGGSFGYGAGQFGYPTGVGVDSAGNIYVSDEAAQRVQAFDASGNFLRAFGWGVDTGAAQFEVCTAATTPCQGGTQGSSAGQLAFAQNVTVDASDYVYVADANNARIQIFTSAGDFLATFGWGVDTGAAQFEVCTWATVPCQSGSSSGRGGEFNYPWGVGVSPLDGKFYVSDFGQARVQVFDVQIGTPAAPPLTITSFDPSVVFSGTSPAQEAALDAAVGVTGYVIEDFEDTTLVPGLTASGGAFGLNSQSAFPNTVWDGTNYFVNQVPLGNGLNFSIAGGTSSFGIGLGDIDVPGVHLFVNDQDFGSIMALPNWVKLGDNVRDVYIRIDAAPGESITSVRIEQVSGAFNDGIFFDHVAFAAPLPAFTEVVITGDSDILNDGLLIAANDFGGSPSAVTVNGVSFGIDQGGLSGGSWGNGGGDFSVDPFSANLDALLSDLKFTWSLTPVSLTIGGLTPGTNYRLQLLFSNDVNSTGDRVEVTVDADTWILDDWQPDAINLIARFTATSSSVVTTFAPGVGSTNESGRAVLNGYVIHEVP